MGPCASAGLWPFVAVERLPLLCLAHACLCPRRILTDPKVTRLRFARRSRAEYVKKYAAQDISMGEEEEEEEEATSRSEVRLCKFHFVVIPRPA